jgi:hypothetical protein
MTGKSYWLLAEAALAPARNEPCHGVVDLNTIIGWQQDRGGYRVRDENYTCVLTQAQLFFRIASAVDVISEICIHDRADGCLVF